MTNSLISGAFWLPGSPRQDARDTSSAADEAEAWARIDKLNRRAQAFFDVMARGGARADYLIWQASGQAIVAAAEILRELPDAGREMQANWNLLESNHERNES